MLLLLLSPPRIDVPVRTHLGAREARMRTARTSLRVLATFRLSLMLAGNIG